MNNDYLEGVTTVQQRNVTSIYEPQNPLYHKEKDAYFYPLTSEKQIVMDDGRRLNAVLEEDFAKKDEVNSAKTEAVNDSKVYINEQIKKASPRNLLDNSDFRNPVNQRGQTSYTVNGHTIDRWQIWNGSVDVADGYITANTLYQLLDLPLDKVYTFAVCRDDGNITIVSGSPSVPLAVENDGMTIHITNLQGYSEVVISGGKNVVWAALYEGEYTIDTLPEYQPKGYENELLVCRQYDGDNYIGLRKFGQPRNLLDNSDFRNPVNQRGQTSYSGGVYGIDRWFGDNADSVITTTENGIIATGAYMVQILEKKHVGKALTICAKDAKGSIAVATCTVQQSTGYSWLCTNTSTNGTFVGILQTDTGVLRANVQSVTGVAIEWVALYEGEYTVDTLPEYQPKGYGAELTECQRYYFESDFNTQAIAFDAYSFYAPYMYLPVQMRENCNISVIPVSKNGTQNALSRWTGSEYVDVTDYIPVTSKTAISFRSNGGFVTGSIYATSKVIVSADL